MQTTLLPSLNATSGANAAAPQRSGESDGGAQFGATLSHEISQRSSATQQPPSANDGAPKAQPQPPQNQQASADAKSADAKAADAKPADNKQAEAKPAAGDKEDQDKDAPAKSAAAPATDMLAIVADVAALLQKQGAVAPGAAPAADAKGTAKGAGAAASPLAGLTSAGTDAAARFNALARGGQAAAPAHAAADTDTAPSARGASLAANPAATLAPGAAGQAPTGAPAALAAQLAAAMPPEPKAAPDQAAAQLLAAAQVQQLAPGPAQVQAAALASQNTIPAQLGTTAWDNQVGQRVVWMAAGGEQSASLTLNPPDLGPLQVVLSVNGDQASVAFSSSHQDVRHALESALPRLREMMGESGIALGNATVDAGQRQAQDNWQGAGQPGTTRAGGATQVAADDDTPAMRATTRTTVIGDRGMVDTFA